MDLNRKNKVMSNDDSPPDGRFTNHTDRTETVSQMDYDTVDNSDPSQLEVIVEGRSSDPTTHGGDAISGNVVGRSTDPTKNADEPMAQKNSLQDNVASNAELQSTIAKMAAQIALLQEKSEIGEGRSKDPTPLRIVLTKVCATTKNQARHLPKSLVTRRKKRLTSFLIVVIRKMKMAGLRIKPITNSVFPRRFPLREESPSMMADLRIVPNSSVGDGVFKDRMEEAATTVVVLEEDMVVVEVFSKVEGLILKRHLEAITGEIMSPSQSGPVYKPHP